MSTADDIRPLVADLPHEHDFLRYELREIWWTSAGVPWSSSWPPMRYVSWETWFVGYRCTICGEEGYEVPV